MKQVRMGIIGVGVMGSAHANCLIRGEIADMVLTALCDTDPARRAQLKETYPDIPVFETHRALLESGLTDAVLIATPHYFHPTIAADSLSAGQHVLSEKPAGVRVSDVEGLGKLAEQCGKVFGIMFNQRTNPLFQKAKELVQSGRLGEPKRFVWIVTNWYRHQAYYDSGSWRATWSGEGGGVLMNQAPHNLDLWQWIFGMPKSVRAFCREGQYHNIEVEDDATIYAEYENGATALFVTSTGELPGTNRLEVCGDRGKLVLENGELRFWELPYAEREICYTAKDLPDASVASMTEIKPEGEESAHPGILRNFAANILRGEPLLAPGAEGVYELTISNAAYLSSWTGETVNLPLDTARFDALLEERAKRSEKKHTSEKNEALSDFYKQKWQVNW